MKPALVKPHAVHEEYAELNFEKWLFRLGRRLFFFLSATWFLSSISLAYGWTSKLLSPAVGPLLMTAAYQQTILRIVTVINALVIFLILLLPPRGPRAFNFGEAEPTLPDGNAKEQIIRQMCGYHTRKEWVTATGTAAIVFRHFDYVWLGLWVFWLLLSLPLVISSMGPLAGFSSIGLALARTLFSNCNTLMFIFCYEILAQPTTKGASPNYRPELNWGRWLAVVIGFSFVQFFVVSVIHLQVGHLFDWISGLGSAIALALFIGQLDSRYLNPPLWFLVMMYAYVAIQSGFAVFGMPAKPLEQALLVNVALFFKCALYLYVVWLFHSGRFLFYLVRTANMNQRVGDEWRQFSEALERKAG